MSVFGFISSKWGKLTSHIDWVLLGGVVLISLAGLVAMNSFSGDSPFFARQVVWLAVSLVVFFVVSFFDLRFLRRTGVVMTLFGVACGLLLLLFVFGSVVKGTQGWLQFGFFSFQPAEPAKLILILVLAKYFTRRHVEIAHVRHIFISGLYAFALFMLILLQPDFGSSIIIFFLWFGIILLSGISKKHLMAVFLVGIVSVGFLWTGVFEPYQKDRIRSFVHPLADIQGAGYNAYQSTVAVGSGGFWGKGVAYGTQSKLQFLPEHETDFIFAAFAEEWGFVGVVILFMLFLLVVWRILVHASRGASNFETLFGMGLVVLFMVHFIINIGMNIGLLPVTGITAPFMSYGGSHLITEYLALGMLMAMSRYEKSVGRGAVRDKEIVGCS